MFKVLELHLQNHPFLGDLSLNFTTKDEYENGPYTTVIIGPNGTGKSNILRIITDIFREIENTVNGSKEQELVKCKYQMKYYLDGDIYFYTNSKRKLLQSSNGELSQSLKNNLPIGLSELALPNLIIAFSIMLNDRFFVPKDYEGRIYEYLGVRRLKTPSIGGTQTFTRRIVELLLYNIENENFINHLEEVLELIGYDKELKMVFYPRYRDKIFTGNLTSEYLTNFYLNWKEVLSKRKSPPYGHSFFINTISKDKYFIDIIVNMINSLTEKYNLNKRGSSIVFSIYDKNIISLYKDHFLYLSSLDLITDF
ncbi:MAG: AAA family ATPase, partial [Ignavibacteria bacterium]|nr:AAA family ATPase [Ignavibacteria bacterium]